MQTKPKISIIIPVLNRETTIEKAIQSVLNQRYENVELIIMDGGSTDNTINIIKKYCSDVTYWQSQQDNSAAVGANIGIQKATGDLIALLMADDWYELGIFQKVAEAFRQHAEVDILSCGGRIVRHDKKHGLKLIQKFSKARQLDLNFYNICYDVSAICCRFISRSVYQKIGLYIPFDSQKKHMLTNDKEFLIRAMLANVKNVFVNHIGHTYLAHKDSFSFGNHRAISQRHCEEHMQIAKTYLSKSNLSNKQLFFLKYWYLDQCIKLSLFKMLDLDFVTAMKITVNGMRRHIFLSPFVFCCAVPAILVKRIFRLFKKVISPF